MKKYLLFLGALLLLTHVMFSQELKKEWVIGVIADELGHPMPGTSVHMKNTSYGDAVDKNGLFELEMSEKDTIVISHIGYETEKRTLNDIKQNGLINMREYTYMLGEVWVVANGKYRVCGGGCYYLRESDPIPVFIGFQPRNWQYYPNPTKDFIQINTFEKEGFIRLFSVNGIELQKIQVMDDIEKIKVNDLPNGIYFLRYDRAGWGEIIGQFVKI